MKPRFVGFRRTVEGEVDAQRLFAALTQDGSKAGCVLLQSSDNIAKYGERSFGVVGSSLRVEGRGSAFVIESMDDRGRALIPMLAERVETIADQFRVQNGRIEGEVSADYRSVSGHDRPFRRNQMDIVRALAFCAESDEVTAIPTHGLFGCFGYPFVHQYELFDRTRVDVLHDPDYVFFLATRMFLIDHAAKRTHLVSSVPVVEGADLAPMLIEAGREVERMKKLAADPPDLKTQPWHIGPVASDTDHDTFCHNVERIKKDIFAGRAFQVVYGRMFDAPFSGRPFDVYCRLSQVNPSPYMFYVSDGSGVLLAASPEMAMRATREPAGMRIEIRPIAGTKPRGFINGTIDPLMDAKYETALKVDRKELAEHTMLVDLARNDVASICQPGTIVVDEPMVIEKYSHVQHLVSNVRGLLRDDLDALHAYLATMNMGTVTGAPKLEAMKMINELETSCRGFYGGGVGYVLPDGQMDTALVIRAIQITEGRAYVRAGAGIVADSVPESEWVETANKAAACLGVLGAYGNE